jgi:host factor-I protein
MANNVQQTFINEIMTKQIKVTVHLISGIKLEGRIKASDDNCILLDGRQVVQLIFNNAIATIMPPSIAEQQQQ